MEETGGPGENHRPAASHWQTLSYNVVSPCEPALISVMHVFLDEDWDIYIKKFRTISRSNHYSFGQEILKIKKLT